ncbi:anti-anti-sigma factor [Streptomyces avermitilis]|uniref:STAS domain-containing protein n=1 Tax=Streptomyces TaxID=1883 RepID=UPI0005661664|nr:MULTISPECIES: STAS domain-containing protein [Streptomyces]KUN54791.1 anti-anti-sigma factor [Streptomyces avermitilis]MYS96724.1 anti-sigma factor antagonist [Streptomyces sp. SID5469]OOV21856.1 anti-anti-sigma factor [Streptomyces avermitilis]
MEEIVSTEQAPLSIDVTLPREDVALVTVKGFLDVDTGTELHHHLANQMHHGRRHLLLDLSAVPFMDSSGINIILKAYKETRRVEGSVRLIDPAPAVQRILDLTGVSLTVPSAKSLDEALAETGDATDRQ